MGSHPGGLESIFDSSLKYTQNKKAKRRPGRTEAHRKAAAAATRADDRLKRQSRAVSTRARGPWPWPAPTGPRRRRSGGAVARRRVLLLLLLRWPSSAELVAAWGAARASAVAPALAAASAACLALSAMLLADAVLMAAACFARRRPDRRYRATRSAPAPAPTTTTTTRRPAASPTPWCSSKSPCTTRGRYAPTYFLTVRIRAGSRVKSTKSVKPYPYAYTARVRTAHLGSVWSQVYKLSIGAACGLSWPSDRLIVQVLDDSTDPTVKVSSSFGSVRSGAAFVRRGMIG